MKIHDYDHDEYTTTQEFNKLMTDNFTAILAQAKLTAKNDIADYVKKIYFNGRQENLNKKCTSNKTKYLEAKNKLSDLANKVAQISEKEYNFLLGRMYFACGNGYHNF